MALRLVLVSAVAGLGLSLPSGDDLNAWALQAQNWMNAKLAEWDTPTSDEKGSFVIATEAIEPGPESVAAPIPAPAPIHSEEIDAVFDAVQEEIVSSFAADLTPAESGPKVLLTETETETETKPDAAPAPASDEFDVVQEEIAATFGADVAPAPAVANADLAPAGPKPEQDPAGSSLAEPMVVCNDMYSCFDDDLIVEAEDKPASSRNEQWAQAIRLTRQAAYAWANLLHGPAVVTIDH